MNISRLLKSYVVLYISIALLCGCSSFNESSDEYYTVSWEEPIANGVSLDTQIDDVIGSSHEIHRYSGKYLGKILEENKSYPDLEGNKQIVYTDTKGDQKIVNPYDRNKVLKVKKNSIIKIQMVAGTNDGEIGIDTIEGKSSWNDNNKPVTLEYKIDKNIQLELKDQQADGFGGTHFYWYLTIK